MQAQGSVLTNKYAEGLPQKRYYGGCEFVDEIEELAIQRAKKLFNANWANVQPHSGAQANAAVFLSLLEPGDTILGMDLSHGGHLTHGSPVNMSGKWFNAVHENFASIAVMQAQGSVLTNKYAEGLPQKRYYGGCEFVDEIEELAIQRAKKLFNSNWANVQPHSGAQANAAVFLSLLKPGDTIMGMDLSHGGHLTHGSPVNMSGKWFNAVHYGVNKETSELNFDEIREIALETKPKLIICGYSATYD